MSFRFKEDILPHVIGVAVFYLITIAYFSPILFDGKMLFQTDILQWEGSSKEVIDHREATGEEALWTNRMFGGMPSYLIHSNPKGDITNAIVKVLTLGLPHPIGSLFFGMVGMYVLLLSFRIRPLIAIAASVAFALNSFNLLSLEAGHNGKIWALCIIPLIFAGMHLSFTGKRILGAALTALGVLLQLKFNHLQITYYTAISVVIYGIGQLFYYYRNHTLPDFGKSVAILLLAAILGVAGNAARLTSVMEYSKYSTRGPSNLEGSTGQSSGLDKDYAFHWSQGKLETFTFLVPNFFGGGSVEPLPDNSASEVALRRQGIEPAQVNEFIRAAPTYWGDQPGTGGPIYGGVILILLFIIGVAYAPPLYRNIFVAITITTLILAWGKNIQWVNYTLFDILPGFNKFRAVSMALGITLFAVPVLGALGLEHLLRQSPNNQTNKFWISSALTVGLIATAILTALALGFRGSAEDAYPDWLQEALRQDRKSMLISDAIRSLLFVGIAIAIIAAMWKSKLNNTIGLSVLALLMLVDVWGIGKRYLNEDSFSADPSQQYFTLTPADQRILQDPGYFRVLNLQNPFNEARTSYRFNSIGGYHGAKLGRYQELIEQVLTPEMNQFIQRAQEGDMDFTSLSALNMLNTKYIMAGRGENAVFQNPQANGPAWFPTEIVRVRSNQEEIQRLSGLDTRNVATVNELYTQPLTSGHGKIELSSYSPNRLEYTIDAERGGLAVFSEIYYPEGWKATINGNEEQIIRVNYLLRGLVVPQGTSQVIFEFDPKSYHTASVIMLVAQYLVIIIFLAGLALTFRRGNFNTTRL